MRNVFALLWTGLILAAGVAVGVLVFGNRIYTGTNITMTIARGETLVVEHPVLMRIVPETFQMREVTTGKTLESQPPEFQALDAGSWFVEHGTEITLMAKNSVDAKVLISDTEKFLGVFALCMFAVIWLFVLRLGRGRKKAS